MSNRLIDRLANDLAESALTDAEQGRAIRGAQAQAMRNVCADLHRPEKPPRPGAATDSSEDSTGPVKAPGGGYGLDAELAAQREAKYDHALEAEVRQWMETVVGEPLADPSFGPALKDGVMLCKLINAIKPGQIRKVETSKMPFKQMENISNFLRSCRALGVPECDLFETVDLYELKDLGLVVRCLLSLGRAVQRTVPTFAGPHIGAKLATENKRDVPFKPGSSGAMTKMGMGSAGVMERIGVSKVGPTAGAEYAGDALFSGSTRLTSGGAGVQERIGVSRTGPTMGAEYAGASSSDGATKQTGGSAGVQERIGVSKVGITVGADAAGQATSDCMSRQNIGGAGIQERVDVSKHGITFGANASAR